MNREIQVLGAPPENRSFVDEEGWRTACEIQRKIMGV